MTGIPYFAETILITTGVCRYKTTPSNRTIIFNGVQLCLEDGACIIIPVTCIKARLGLKDFKIFVPREINIGHPWISCARWCVLPRRGGRFNKSGVKPCMRNILIINYKSLFEFEIFNCNISNGILRIAYNGRKGKGITCGCGGRLGGNIGRNIWE